MIRDEDFHRLIRSLYDAAFDSSGWAPFLELYARALNGTMAGLTYWDRASKGSQAPLFIGMDTHHARECDEHYAARNPWLIDGPFQAADVAVPSHLQCPVDERLKSEFYNDCVPRCDRCYGIGARVAHTETLYINLTLLRLRRSDAYGESDLLVVRTLMPHLQRGFQLHLRLTAIGLEVGAALAAMERLAFGVLLLAGDGSAVFVNREARRILDQRDGLTLSRNGLVASNPRTTTALRGFIKGAALTSQADGLSAGGSLSVGRPSMKRPLGLLVAPLSADRFVPARRGAVVAVFVSDPEHATELPEAVVRRMFTLTRAEAAFAVLLAAGHSVESAAASLGITVPTARTHLKRVLRKTRTRTQTQLVRVLLGATFGHR
jgi:DNA-binding CsgD family transcriptional regulator